MKMKGKKRKERTRSSSPPTQSKKARESISHRFETHASTPDPFHTSRYLRAKSIFRGQDDPYLPRGDPESAPSLPSVGDWKFRLKVLCLENANDEILKDAIQGLVKICFPERVLEEIGVDVVEKHMQESGASHGCISRMRKVFHTEMIRRVAWMLADHVDTTEKTEVAVLAVLTACNQLKQGRVDDKLMDDIICAFQRFRERALDGDMIEPDGDMPSNDIEHPADTTELDGDSARHKKRNKLTLTRPWDIDSSDIKPEHVPLYFKRTCDLYSFHAFPIIRRELGHGTTNASVMARIEENLAAMSVDERAKWKHSFHKLRDGDLTMLQQLSSQDHNNESDDGSETTSPEQSPSHELSISPKANTTFPNGKVKSEFSSRGSTGISPQIHSSQNPASQHNTGIRVASQPQQEVSFEVISLKP